MASREALTSPKPIRAIRLSAMMAGLLGVALVACLNSFASVVRHANPELVAQILPHDPLAAVIAADNDLTMTRGRVSLPAVAQAARTSLARQPLNTRAVRLLAFAEESAGKSKHASELFHLSEQVSRRDLGTQLWLIEAAVNRNDMRTALDHYDIALRTYDTAQVILFPVLTAAADDAEVRAAMVPVLRRHPPWLADFIKYAATKSDTPSSVATLLAQAGPVIPAAKSQAVASELVARLATSANPQSALTYYRTLPGADPRKIVATGFSAATTDRRFVPLTWEVVAGGSSGATVESNGNALRLFASAGERSVVLRRILFLSPGSYRLSSATQNIGRSHLSDSFVQIKCMKSNQYISNAQGIPRFYLGNAFVSQAVIVPPDCSAQSVEFVAVGGSDQEDAEFLIKDFSIG